MAESGGIEIDDVLSCIWCKKQKLTQLVQLGCFHLSCKVCLQSKLGGLSPGTAFNCPECDMSCMVPMGGVDEFPDELLQHKINEISTIYADDKPNCKLCEQESAVSSTSSVCITCTINLCENDAKCHQVMPDHTVITKEELCVEPNLSLLLKSNVNSCQKHSLDNTYFCKECQQQICPECASLIHSDHDKDSLKIIAAEYRKIFEEKIGEIQRTQSMAKENLQKLDKIVAEIQEKYRSTEVKENLQNISQEEMLKINEMNSEIAKTKNKIRQCKSAESYIRVFLKYSFDIDVIKKFQEFVSKFEMIEKSKSVCSLSEKLTEMRLNENVEETKEINCKILSGFKLEAKWEDDWWSGLSMCEGEFLVVSDQKMKWFTVNGKCKSEIKCMDLGYAWNVDVCQDEVYVSDQNKRAVLVFDRKGKMKRKLCLPESENGADGALGLAVDRENKDIYVCSPMTDIVYKSENEKLIPWITNGLSCPHYLCVTLDRHLVVSNFSSNTVVKYNSEGQCVWSYGCEGSGEGELSQPWGVCSDLSGHIFISDGDNERIVVISKDGHFITEVDIGVKIDEPLAVGFRNQTLVMTTNSFTTNYIYVINVSYT